ncbi:MAG: tetratricopeptide repeat protein [Candidatus Latescibacterota bacterium]|nr:tetratricopeptide repeat protein [Candidatus Latescibacterota bacterium]MEE2627811.1 tetratricopeptide repeat protein [Candidatus Latescibacterota bacterium]MEE2727030.1 tetratricopeptide repeat protein [Candidatus Latescibacterota bacterium]
MEQIRAVITAAQSLYIQALANDPDDAHARVELAALYRDMGQPQVGRGVLAADGDLVLTRRYAALIYSALGRQEEALASYEELARLQTAYASIQISLGIVHSQRGDWAAAEEAFKRALSLGNDGGDAALHPDNAELHASLGDCIQETGRARCGTGGG